MSYTEFDYNLMVKHLDQCSDAKYRDFHSSLSVGSNFLYGVRVPILRDISKHILAGDWREFLAIAKDNSYEEILIQGLVISQAKCPLEEKLNYTKAFVGKIDNWAICDTFCGGFRASKSEPEKVWEFIMGYADSSGEFERRFVAVMLMEHFLIDEYIDEALDVLINIDRKDYYVMMAVAWAFATAFVKYREKVLDILQRGVLDATTQNKTIQKCRESFRVSKEDKEILLGLKIKSLN